MLLTRKSSKVNTKTTENYVNIRQLLQNLIPNCRNFNNIATIHVALIKMFIKSVKFDLAIVKMHLKWNTHTFICSIAPSNRVIWIYSISFVPPRKYRYQTQNIKFLKTIFYDSLNSEGAHMCLFSFGVCCASTYNKTTNH